MKYISNLSWITVMFLTVLLTGCKSNPKRSNSSGLALPGVEREGVLNSVKVFDNNPFDSYVTRNTNVLFKGEMSGIGFRNSPGSVGDSRLCVTLITPRHAITAAHTTPTAAIEYRFIGKDGKPYIAKTIPKPRSESTMTNKYSVPFELASGYKGTWTGNIDVGIVEFENNLPTDVVKPLKLWDGAIDNELKNLALDVWLYGFTQTNFLISPSTISYTRNAQLNFYRSTDQAWLITGDSGSPTLYYDEKSGETSIMGVHVSGGGGRTSDYAGYDAFVGHPVVREWVKTKIDFSEFESSSTIPGKDEDKNEDKDNVSQPTLKLPHYTNYVSGVTNYIKASAGNVIVITAE